MKILFVCRDEVHASSRVRALQYVEPLQGLGHEVDTLIWQPQRSADVARLAVTLVTRARHADVTVLVKPRLHPLVLAALARAQPNVWIDLDDAVWTWPPPFPDRFAAAARHAKGFLAGSSWLADRLRDRAPCSTVAVVPTAVDTDRYLVPAGREQHAPCVVGWIGGPASLTDFASPAAAALRALVAEQRVTLRVVSSTPLDPSVVPAEFEPWAPETEVTALQGFDIGIMPLRDDEASWGRCGLKALQYMAVGAPVVASPIGAACEILRDASGGVLATTTDEWRNAIVAFADDDALRLAMGARARARVEDAYSVSVVAPRIVDALTSAVT